MRESLSRVLLIISITLLLPPSLAFAKVTTEGGMYIVDDAEGYAPVKNGKKSAAREEAKRMAYRDALEKALGACVTGITERENYIVTRDKVFSKVAGIVKDFKITSERVDKDGMLTLKGVCKVGERALDGALGPDVIAMLGNPRIMILVDERIGDQVPFVSTTESEALRIFERAGYLIVDPDQARTLLHLNASSVFDDPVKLAEAARTLRADIIVVGKAAANAFAKQKVQGIDLYGVSGTVQLKAVLTQTAYQISSQTVSQSTGKKPVQTIGAGAERCFRQATALAAEQIVYKIAYNMASVVTVNVKIADATFRDVEAIEGYLQELVGKSGEVYERSYRDSLLEIDVVSDRTARNVASFLSEHGVAVDTFSAQTVNGRIKGPGPDVVVSDDIGPVMATVRVHLTDVRDFGEAEVIEDAFRTKLVGESGRVTGEYKGEEKVKTLDILIAFSKDVKTAREIASFLGKLTRDDFKKSNVIRVDVNGVSESPGSVTGVLQHGLW